MEFCWWFKSNKYSLHPNGQMLTNTGRYLYPVEIILTLKMLNNFPGIYQHKNFFSAPHSSPFLKFRKLSSTPVFLLFKDHFPLYSPGHSGISYFS